MDGKRIEVQPKHLLNDIAKDAFRVLICRGRWKFLQIPADPEHKIQKFLVVLQALIRAIAFRKRIDICEESHRRALRDGADSDDLVLLVEKPWEEAPDPAELLQCIRKISVGDLEITGFRGSVDFARNLVSKQFVLLARLRPQHLVNRILERFQPSSY